MHSTLNLSTWTVGLAELYSRNSTFILTPTRMPTSNLINKEETKVAAAGMRSISEKNYRKVLQRRKYYVYIRLHTYYKMYRLTFGLPHGFNYMKFNHKYNGCYNNSCQRSFWYVRETGSQKFQR